MSAFNVVVSNLDNLSESELRQVYLIVGVRLGIRDGSSAQRGAGARSNKPGKGKAAAAKSSGSRKAASKGNPSRKSQWETHPRYKEYKRLKKVVETQAKERNLSFAAVDTPERAAYNLALSQWLEAKSSFRDHRTDEHETGAASASGEGKGKGIAPPATEAVAGPSKTGKSRPSNWADEVQEEAEEAASSSEEEEAAMDVDPPRADAPVPTSSGAGKTRAGAAAPQRKVAGAKRK